MDAVSGLADQVNGWLKEIGGAVGSPLALDADKRCALSCAHGLVVTVSLSHAEDGLLLHAYLLPPPADALGFFRDLLVRNHNFAGSGGCTLAFDDITGHAALCQTVPGMTLDREGFRNRLGHFISTAAELRSSLSLDPTHSSDTTDSSGDDPNDFLRQFGARA